MLTPPAPLAPAEMSVKMAALASIREVIHTLTDGTDAPDEYAEVTAEKLKEKLKSQRKINKEK